MSRTLDEIKRILLEQHQLDIIANPDATRSRDDRLTKAMQDIPVKRFIEQSQYIKLELLPAIEKKKGKTCADYVFFESVGRSLLWAITVVDRYEYLAMRFTSQKVENQLLKENYGLLERELSKFEALEDIFLTDALDRYAEGVKAKVRAGLRGGLDGK
jgi:hypothetical protein